MGKECCSNVSSRLWGGALRDETKNGCEGVTAGILSMRTGPRLWRARGHREITSSFSMVFLQVSQVFVSRLFQFFLVVWISNGYL